MKLFVAAFGTETNTFSPISTELKDFASYGLYRPGEHPNFPLEFTAPLWQARHGNYAKDWQVIEGTCTAAPPAGLLNKKAYELIRDEILTQIEQSLPLDAVALSMHGAMVAEDYEDCEGDVIKRVRQLIGDGVALGVELDPHCHLTQKMQTFSDILILYKEYPHTDFLERADELLNLLSLKVQNRITPVMTVYDCKMINIYHTTKNPMRDFIDKIKQIEKDKADILSISIAHGFPWGDVKDLGTKILVISDNANKNGEVIAEQLGKELISFQGKTSPKLTPYKDALYQTINEPEGPIILADTADNPGGGAPGDSTFVLEELLTMNYTSVCLGPLWDPNSVEACFSANVGSILDLNIGGKMGETSGQPIKVTATVFSLKKNCFQYFGKGRVMMGNCAAIKINDVVVVLSSLRSQSLGLEIFTNLNIDPRDYKLVILKSSQHFHAAFAPIAKDIIYIDSPGALQHDFNKLNYKNVRDDLFENVIFEDKNS